MNLIRLICFLVVIGLQYSFGLKKKRLLGVILPAIILIILSYFAIQQHSFEPVLYGILGAVGLGVEWFFGYSKSKKHDEEELERMKAKDI